MSDTDIEQLDRLELTEGNDWQETYVLTDSDDAPIDITGYTITFAAKLNLDDTTLAWGPFNATPAPDQVANKGQFSFFGETVPAKFEGKYQLDIKNAGDKLLTLVAGGSQIRVFSTANS